MMKVLISGGGTGGHIFPAVSIANAWREKYPDCEILFVGAESRMEMERVPAAGYDIVGLPVRGFDRKHILKNVSVLVDLFKSMRKAKKIVNEFQPDVAVGVGGYASGAAMKVAARMGVPVLLQEQNGFAGVTNKLLKNDAKKICVAYEGMEKFFSSDKIVLSGNPIRSIIRPCTPEMKEEGVREYGLDPSRKHIFIVGGSLGSSKLNKAVKKWICEGCEGIDGVDVLWQCGKYYKEGVDAFMKEQEEKGAGNLGHIHHSDFIGKMDLAYAAADVVVSRSGASSVSELCVARKAVVFVPSPNVAEDHQTHNAMALVDKGAAMIVKDEDAEEKMIPTALELLGDDPRRASLEENIGKLALPDAALTIAREVYELV